MLKIALLLGFLHVTLLTQCIYAKELEDCSEPWFKCGNGKCISKMWLCDNDNDCGNMKDEENCNGTVSPSKCLSSQFQCDGHCIPETWQCDGEHDCDDEMDENDCENSTDCTGFRCKDKHCIPLRWKCDGQKDCDDGSDEETCPKTCLETEFTCLSGSCVNRSHLCDGKKDCPDASDEGEHCSDSCANVTCSQKCRITPSGPQCYCNEGYKLAKDNRTCTDIDECLQEGFCSHRCLNFPGGYTCSCLPGYNLVNRTCEAKGAEPLLIFSTLQEIRGMYLRSNRYFLIRKAVFKAAAVDVDPTDQRIYWIEISKTPPVYSSKIDGTGFKTILSDGLLMPEDIAVDYVGRNLYITDSSLKQVLACKLDGTMCHVLHSTNTDKPRAIALDHAEGLLYWSDWGDRTKGIYRSGMDGSERTTFVSKDVGWPNGIAVDHSTKRLYWADAQRHTIEYITLDGKTRKVIMTDSVYHPYSLAVFEDNLYWTDWNTFSLDSCNKFTGHKMTLMARENGKHIMGVHVYHPVLVATALNPCWGNTCSHMCVIGPSKSFRCVCPPGYSLSGSKTCVVDNEFPTIYISEESKIFNVRPETVGSHAIFAVPITHMKAIGKMAYDWKSRCMFLIEKATPTIRAVNMTSMAWRDIVKNHLIVPEDLAFDWMTGNLYWVDSVKSTVEVVNTKSLKVASVVQGLGKPVAIVVDPSRSLMFISTLDNGAVLKYDMDGKNRKELYKVSGFIMSLALHPTKSLLFWSDPQAETISSIDYLSSKSDVKIQKSKIGSVVSIAVGEKYLYWTDTKSRELHLLKENTSFAHALALPGSGNALTARQITYAAAPAKSAFTSCTRNNGGCSHLCLNSVSGRSCACPSGTQLSSDGVTCQDKSCEKEEFQCVKGRNCISIDYYCDGSKDCDDGSDEHCEKPFMQRCPGNDFQCKNGRCIISAWKCDRRDDCGDNSDEEDCPAPESCSENQFSCGSGECIPMLWKCDGQNDCLNGSDEYKCHETKCDTELQLRCDHGQCIPRSWVCDGTADCFDNTDERDCASKPKTCNSTQFRCEDGSCIDNILVCDKRKDCDDGSDERNCSKVIQPCKKDRYQCKDGMCIYEHEVCDGYKDCSNGEEELNCTIRPCTHEEYQCPSSKRCITLRWFCDGDEDCDDGADEDINNCTKPKKVITLPPIIQPNECEEFFCYATGKCLPWESVCDGHLDCEDIPDEGGLCLKSCASNGGCGQICKRTPQGSRCGCFDGYELMSDEKTCEDVNECSITGLCSHFCNNTKGSFKCSCAEGYFLEHDHKKCKADGGPATLVYLLKDQMRGIEVSTHSQRVYVSGDMMDMRGMDFDAAGVFFWTEWNEGTINSLTLNSGRRDVIVTDHLKPNYIKWDWISKNIYYTDEDGNVKACDSSGKFCTTIVETIALHLNSFTISPPNGLMFWGVWSIVLNQGSGFIERAEMDGSHRMIIVSDNILYPTAITVDEALKLIFWTDAKLNTLEYADFHGLRRKQVLTGEMNYPFSMTIFEDFVFWSDWGTDSIIRCEKFTGENCLQFHKGNVKSDGFMAVHKVQQPRGVNLCENSSCQELCLLTRSSFSCKCGNLHGPRNSTCGRHTSVPPTYKARVVCPKDFCENGGTCQEVGGKINCQCTNEYIGLFCEIQRNPTKASYYGWIVAVSFAVMVLGITFVIIFLCRKNGPKISKVTESFAIKFRNPVFGRKSGRLVVDTDDNCCDELMLGTEGDYKQPGFTNPFFGKKPPQNFLDTASKEGDFKKWPSFEPEDSVFIGESQTKESARLCIDEASNTKPPNRIVQFFKM